MCAIKRSFGLALMVFLSAYSGFPKDGQAPTAKDNLYSVALFASLAAMEKSWSHIDDSDGGTTIRTDYRHAFVEKDPAITNGLPEHQGEYQVEYLDNRGQTERYNKLRKEFCASQNSAHAERWLAATNTNIRLLLQAQKGQILLWTIRLE